MNLLARFRRALLRRRPDAQETPAFTARTHCSACGTSRWGQMRLSARGSGLAAFRCDVKGEHAKHVTIYAISRVAGRISFRHLSSREHADLGSQIRARANA